MMNYRIMYISDSGLEEPKKLTEAIRNIEDGWKLHSVIPNVYASSTTGYTVILEENRGK